MKSRLPGGNDVIGMLITVEMTFFLKKRGKTNGSSRTPTNWRMLSVPVNPVSRMSFSVTSSLRRIVMLTSRMDLLGHDDGAAEARKFRGVVERHRRRQVHVDRVLERLEIIGLGISSATAGR